jgi:hypothetical protein
MSVRPKSLQTEKLRNAKQEDAYPLNSHLEVEFRESSTGSVGEERHNVNLPTLSGISPSRKIDHKRGVQHTDLVRARQSTFG